MLLKSLNKKVNLYQKFPNSDKKLLAKIQAEYNKHFKSCKTSYNICKTLKTQVEKSNNDNFKNQIINQMNKIGCNVIFENENTILDIWNGLNYREQNNLANKIIKAELNNRIEEKEEEDIPPPEKINLLNAIDIIIKRQ